MKIWANKLAGELKKGTAPVYVVSGDDPLLVQETCDLIRDHLKRCGYTERDLHHAEGNFDWSLLLESAGSMSLFAEQKLIEVRMPNGKPGDQGSRVLQELAEHAGDDNVLLLVLPRADQPMQRSKWFKALESAGLLVQVWPVDRKDLPRWLEDRFRRVGLQASRDAVVAMAERIEGNLLAAVQEIERLRLTARDNRVDVQDVIDGVADSARYDVFKLIDAALAGDAVRAVRMCQGLQHEGVDVLFLVNMLSRELRNLERIKTQVNQGMSMQEAFRKGRIWDKRSGPVKRCLERNAVAHLQQLQTTAGSIDRMVKGLEPGDPWRELQNLLMSLSGVRSLPFSHQAVSSRL